MGMLMYGIKEKREQEKQAQAKAAAAQNDPTRVHRSAIRRASTSRRGGDNAASERRNGRPGPGSVRLSLRNYDVAERDGEVVFARRPPAARAQDADPQSRRTHRADVEDMHWSTTTATAGGGQVGSAQTLAELAAIDRAMTPRHLRRVQDGFYPSRPYAEGYHPSRPYTDGLRARMRLAQSAMRRNGINSPHPVSDSYLPRSEALLEEIEELRREALNISAAATGSADGRVRRHADAATQRPRSPVRQIPGYNELTTDARRELNQIMGSLPRVDGLGDRVRSPSAQSDSEDEGDAWETLLTTMTPDERFPSLESSFNTAAAGTVSSAPGSTQRSNSSSGTGAETAATAPSIANASPAIASGGERLASPGCDEDDTGMATPSSLPELVRVQRVGSPAASVRPEHVRPSQPARSDWQRLQGMDRLPRGDDGPGTPVSPSDPAPVRNAAGRSFDDARRDLERELEEMRMSRMRRLLVDFTDLGDNESIPDELWQAFVPRNVLAGAVAEENGRS